MWSVIAGIVLLVAVDILFAFDRINHQLYDVSMLVGFGCIFLWVHENIQIMLYKILIAFVTFLVFMLLPYIIRILTGRFKEMT